MRTSIKNSLALGVYTKKHRENQAANTWVVFTKGSDGKPVKARMYTGKYSRDRVRSVYSSETGVPFVDTRSRRLSNFK